MRKLSKKLVVLVTMLTMIFGSAITVFASDAQDVSIDTANNSVQVIVSMFGRETAVDFELDQLEKVKD